MSRWFHPHGRRSILPAKDRTLENAGVRPVAACLALASLALSLAGPPAQAQADRADLEFFENRIRPQLAGQCYECHSARARELKGGLRVDTREDLVRGGVSGAAVVPGDPERSLLIQAVRHANQDIAMPRGPDGSKKLPDAVIQDLTRWVRMGAPFPDTEVRSAGPGVRREPHWAFRPVQSPAEPAVRNIAWPRTSIDSFLLAKMEASGLQPAPPADRRTLIRRATFDLTGLPPTPGEIDAFLADSSPDAFARVAERLLSSPRYGECWGRHWLDVVRYADTAGDTADYPVPVAWRYRNYVIDAFNSDKPYDEFLREQVAGDILARQGPRERYAERVTATGYLAISRRFGFDSENYHHLTIQDTIDTLGQSVLGLTLGCARCHNHKFDPISSREYYGLYGILDSTRYAFPGSEQKGKYRAMAPLLPEIESRPRWRAFEARFAALGLNPGAVLRSLDDLDGDFEMQHVASGGSRGVLVFPWAYEGPIAVTQEAQSPFKNLHPFGIVGVNVPAGEGTYRIEQSLHPARQHGLIHVNLDFRAATRPAEARGRHRIWIGAQIGSPAVEILVSSEAVSFPTGGDSKMIRLPKPGEWHNLQLTLDLDARVVFGALNVPGEARPLPRTPFASAWNGSIDFIRMDPAGPVAEARPGLDLDNVGVQEEPIPSGSTSPSSPAAPAQVPDVAALAAQLDALTGVDGDFELQKHGAPPARPWHPGPSSAVKISSASQSSFRNVYPAGELGIHLPGGAGYNGFGQTLPRAWRADSTDRLFASFDFRCVSGEASETGSWRFHLGHGNASTAVELGFSLRELFRRSGDARESVQPLRPGEWYQVQLELNLKARSYTGSIATRAERAEFAGQCPACWDGSIDYTYIDSGGHLAGVKPALDADNFAFGEMPMPSLDTPQADLATGARDSRRMRVDELRREITRISTDVEKARQELNSMLADGPFELAYAVSEGTPRDARLQMRGEPDMPGEVVPRGFPGILGGSALPAGVSGSGRLELATWLTRAENPLTARVLVNRIWQYHFGQGLVKTPNDFGSRGQPPTHPELLDHLATRFVEGGWSIKSLHRLILASASYQQAFGGGPSSLESRESVRATAARPEPSFADRDAYASFHRRRLGAEELRDSILFISGDLDLAAGRGHPFPPPTTWGYTQHAPFSAVYDHRQRSVYLMTQRLKRHPFLALFDGPDPNTSTPDRRETTVPTQALFFLNDPFVHLQSEKLAARLRDARPGEESRIELLYRLALGRLPIDSERAEASEFLAAYRSALPEALKGQSDVATLAALARVLVGSNEFLSID